MAKEKSKAKVKKERWVSICPRCDSIDIITSTWHSGTTKKCKNCGFFSGTFPQIPISKVPKEPKKPEDYRRTKNAYDFLTAKDLKIVLSALIVGFIIMMLIFFLL